MPAVIRVNDRDEYEVPTATLGELRRIKQLFGVVPRDFADVSDPDVIGGLLYVAMKRANVAPNDDAIVARIDAISKVEFIAEDEDEDPTPAAEEHPDAAGDVTVSSPETTPEPSGNPSTPASTESQRRIA